MGLLLVVLASSAALGFCTHMGLDLNATSTQVQADFEVYTASIPIYILTFCATNDNIIS